MKKKLQTFRFTSLRCVFPSTLWALIDASYHQHQQVTATATILGRIYVRKLTCRHVYCRSTCETKPNGESASPVDCAFIAIQVQLQDNQSINMSF